MTNVLFFIGPPGVGKDTQAEAVAEKFGYTIVSPGELLRDAGESSSDLGKEIKAITKSGVLVPDWMVDKIMREKLDIDNPPNQIWSGFPRRIEQVELFEALQKEYQIDLKKVVYFDLAEDKIIERLSGRLYAPISGRTYHILYSPPKVAGICDESGEQLIRRPDDAPDAVRVRLKVFSSEVQPILDYYQNKGLLIKINAEPTIAEVTADLFNKLQL